MTGIEFLQLAQVCGRSVPPATLLAIARTESALSPWALSVNTPRALARRAGLRGAVQLARAPRSREEAIAWATALQRAGLAFSVGLMQVSSAHLTQWGLSVQAAIEPCSNVRLGAWVLEQHWSVARSEEPERDRAFFATLSRYNAGDARTGVVNGYVERVLRQQ